VSAIARNFIGYQADGTKATAEVHASIDRSSVDGRRQS
jgi:hypothetical protein